MRISTDRTGFPLVEADGIGSFNLWPITKLQFERFISETNKYGDYWYEAALELNPRISCRHLGKKDYEHFFMTGILPGEALDFARWLGDGFDIPTIEEWREFMLRLEDEKTLNVPVGELSARALTIQQRLSSFLNTPLKFALMEDGLVEWVRDDGKYVGLGSPRSSFHPNAWNPLSDRIKVLNTGERLFYFGFRLVRRYGSGQS
jgi:hypothetical protein